MSIPFPQWLGPGSAVSRLLSVCRIPGGLHALLEALRFYPRGGEELGVNVQRKSRTRTPPNIDNAPNRIAGQLLFLGHAREFVK